MYLSIIYICRLNVEKFLIKRKYQHLNVLIINVVLYRMSKFELNILPMFLVGNILMCC